MAVLGFLQWSVTTLRLRQVGSGWAMKGQFMVNILFDPADSQRYEYRQDIKGEAYVRAGIYRAEEPHSVDSWLPVADATDVTSSFKVPGGLSKHHWKEDGLVSSSGVSRFGYRDQPKVMEWGLVDMYVPFQSDGSTYSAVDTYGLEGTTSVVGYRILVNIHYRGKIIDRQRGNKIVQQKYWSYACEDLIF